MGIPCIACQENCPVSPEAITTRTVLEPAAGLDRLTVTRVGSRSIHVNFHIGFAIRSISGHRQIAGTPITAL
jgi:hypothetical protein